MITLFVSVIAGCNNVQIETAVPLALKNPVTIPTLPASAGTALPTTSLTQPFSAPDLSTYALPDPIDPAKHYLFYLHGKIIEDQGIPAISPYFGEYKYLAILEKIVRNDFVVISEPRTKNTNSNDYAGKVVEQVTDLLKASVQPKKITILGASKGAGITVLVLHALANKDMNFVIMSICHPNNVAGFI